MVRSGIVGELQSRYVDRDLHVVIHADLVVDILPWALPAK